MGISSVSSRVFKLVCFHCEELLGKVVEAVLLITVIYGWDAADLIVL